MTEVKNRVLIVDDVEQVRDGIGSIVESEGYRVHTASNGFEALDVIKHNEIDLIVSDILMPEMDGIEMCNQIKELFPDMKFILISGGGREVNVSSSYDYLDTARKLTGIKDILKKPFDPEELISLIDSMLKNS